MKVNGDTLSTMLGCLAGLLLVQQEYLPDLIPQELTVPILATLVGGYGVTTNKEEVKIPFTENTKKQKRICELEAELRQLKEELEASRPFFPEPDDEE